MDKLNQSKAEGRTEEVRQFLLELQSELTCQFEDVESSGRFQEDRWEREGGGGGRSRVLEGGEILEKAGINFSDVQGEELPLTAANRKPHLAGASWRAMGVSVVVHPSNPLVPTSHMNVRFFEATPEGGVPEWWFGGGFDLTPYYPHLEDVQRWHLAARRACDPFGEHLYPSFKQWCDEYFFLPHRGETRGVGGIFYDDHSARGHFGEAFGLMKSVGRAYGHAYAELMERRKAESFTQEQRDFQLHRRGRYAEFNLVYDRGTHFGLQSGGRTESILMSLPPKVRWTYDYQPGQREKAMIEEFFKPRDWLGEAGAEPGS